VARDGSGAANVTMLEVALPLTARYWCETSRGSETLKVVLPLELCVLVAIVRQPGVFVSSVSVVLIVIICSDVFWPLCAGLNVAVTVLPLPVMGARVAPAALAGPTGARSANPVKAAARMLRRVFFMRVSASSKDV
jgi:hypothetical protein